jgi:hypothetical protein
MRPHDFQLPINRKKRKRKPTHPRVTLYGDIVMTAAELDAERYDQAMKRLSDTRSDTSDDADDAPDGGTMGDGGEESDTTSDT